MKSVEQILRENNLGIRLDLGGGGNPQEGFVNMDYRDLPTVDIVHDIQKFPWPLPDESVSLVLASHILEHLDPATPDIRLVELVNLLVKKKILTEKEVRSSLGEVNCGPLFVRVMNELWRIMKINGQVMISVPFGGSRGFFQDPTHTNPIIPATFAYFDPLVTDSPLYQIYRPLPWKIIRLFSDPNGNIECVLEKRLIDKSYGTLIPDWMTKKQK